MYNLVNVVARLDRAGDRNGKAWQKVKSAIDQLAGYLSNVLPGGGVENKLPDGYIFKHWPSKEYRLEKGGEVSLTREKKDVWHLLRFCEDIHLGWPVRVADFLDAQSTRLELAAAAVFETLPRAQPLGGLLIDPLIERLENDIRFGCHLAETEAGRSLAGKQLRMRGEPAKQALLQRIRELNESVGRDPLSQRVRDGLIAVHSWMESKETISL